VTIDTHDDDLRLGIGLYSRCCGVSGCDLDGRLVTGVVRFHEGRFELAFPEPVGLGGLGGADIRCYRGMTRLE
jgi:hypothetical protein